MSTLEESFEHCRCVARNRARNFYYAFLLLPPDQKLAMCAVYSFMRHADDIGDRVETPVGSRRVAINNWEDALKRALKGHYGGNPVLPALHDTVQRYNIPREYFFALIEGIKSDLSPRQPRSFDELYSYCYQVASVVGMTCVHIWGCNSPEALRLAEKCGVAFQLTNILRDIPEDAQMGRVYLPKTDLEQFGLSAEELIAGKPGKHFGDLMAFEWNRANLYYSEVEPLLDMVNASARPALWAMISIYYNILRRIREHRYDVFTHRAELSSLEKTWIALRAFKLQLTGRRPPYPV
jgi:phytoene synthase